MNSEPNPASARPGAPPEAAEAMREFALALAGILASLAALLVAHLRWVRWAAPFCPALARTIAQLDSLAATLAKCHLPAENHARRPRQPAVPAAAPDSLAPCTPAPRPAQSRQPTRIARIPRHAPPTPIARVRPSPCARRRDQSVAPPRPRVAQPGRVRTPFVSNGP